MTRFRGSKIGVTSVPLQREDTIAWSYSVNKGRGQKESAIAG